MTERENLFRPIHKGLRSMIYELGRRLQTTDFTDEVAARAIVKELRENLNLTLGNCYLCLLRAHSQHEEKDFFRPLKSFDPDVVALMIDEHREIVAGILRLSQTCNEVLAEVSPSRRIEIGDRLYLEANDLFAFYLRHMNNEEATVVPVMWEHFTDEQLRKLRAQYHTSVPVRRLEAWMRWTLPALNVNELVVFFRGLKQDGPPELYDYMVRLAGETVDPVRWESARDRAGL
jgi:Hemerythrin HHE cation binding domain